MVLWMWLMGGVVGLAGLYGLHRACLAMEDRGWIYYLRKQPTRGGGSCFIALQEIVEPRSCHVQVVAEEKRSASEDDVPGSAEPPRLLKTPRDPSPPGSG